MKFTFTEKRRQYLDELELHSLEDILNYFPRKYVSYNLSKINQDNDGNRVCVRGIITSKSKLFRFNKSLDKFSFRINYDGYSVNIVIFNRSYLYKNITLGNEVLVAGRLDFAHKDINANEIYLNDLDSYVIRPVYKLPIDVTLKEFQKVVLYAFNNVGEEYFNQIIPNNLMTKYHLISKKEAIYNAHFPSSQESIRQSLRYLKYQELLKFATSMMLNRKRIKGNLKNKKKTINRQKIKEILLKSNFTLTNDQVKACKEIYQDIESTSSMYRLLQGDVGSGKTLVAAIALASICFHNFQGVLLAPTDILARQHFEFLTEFLKDFRIGLLVSSIKNKSEIKEKLFNHEIDIIVGTTALIEDDVQFDNLGIIVIDEQHRFGVNQREKLILKGNNVDVLSMSATPIPRSLALSLYGDMDVSTLKEFPNKKREVKSEVIATSSIKKLIKPIKEMILKNQKIFIICPLIEGESKRSSATNVYDELKDIFQDDVLLLHGRMKDEEKNDVMLKFKKDSYHILVSTTVIEVGIDIKDASMMIIFDANSFGLAQLHQLRGRIGRNGQESICYFLSNTNDEEAIKRLQFLESSNDGFEIARFDLALRGPGEITGVRQSGIPDFFFADLVNDLKILEVARDDAKMIIEEANKNDEYQNYLNKL
ncbi:MAG: ATP-dependent DNA helicase RecG [Bacilli bacterium]|nr:ATP-dependent DNA helicase RecG [Bacilli bacterium]